MCPPTTIALLEWNESLVFLVTNMEITVLIITLDLNVVVGLPCLDLVADSADTTTNIVYMLESFTAWVVLAVPISSNLWIQGLFDRFFIDWYWVGKTKAWEIPGTDDLKPYIPTKIMIGKWMSTILMNPLIALIIAGVMQFTV